MTARLCGLLLIAASAAQGYYHFLQYADRDGRRIALPERFDLEATTSRTVPYFIAERGPDKFANGDNLTALVSQLQLAAAQWSNVETSALRLQFGGFADDRGNESEQPGIDIVFDEIPPGLIAIAGPVVKSEVRPGQNFIPIERSILILPKDMSNLASAGESAFGTFVHEFGHTVGLQHSMTSSAMATQLTRAQSRGLALSDDDRAGISILYPARTFRPNLGVIEGRVTEGSNGVALASVTAMTASGRAIGALTNPDGTYRIEGLPPGRYYIYAHPLPPAQQGESSPANLRLPLNPEGTAIQPGPTFDLQFYPGVRDHNQATAVAVEGGAEIHGIDFRVTRRDPLRLYNVLAYSFPGQVATRPAYVNRNGNRNFFVATGTGLMNGDAPASGLRAQVLGGATGVSSVGFYFTGYLRFDLAFSEESGNGFRHLILSTPTDVYVQPRAFALTDRQPPRVDTVAAPSGGTVAIQGTGLSMDTRIFFDGAPALVRNYDESSGALIVVPPPAPSGHSAVVTAVNADGQSSLFLEAAAPPKVALDGPAAGSITVTPTRLPAGSDSVVEIEGVNTDFANGLVSLGFGSSDITVRRVWVVSPSKLIAHVRVGERAPLAPVDVTVINGLRRYRAVRAFSAGPADSSRFTIFSLSAKPETGITSVPAGGAIVILLNSGVSGLPRAVIGSESVAMNPLAPSLYSVTIPADMPAGPAVLRISTSTTGESLPLAVEIHAAPIEIGEFQNSTGETIDEQHPAKIGDKLTVRLARPVDSADAYRAARVTVNAGGIEHLAQMIGRDRVQFTLLPSTPERTINASVTIDGRSSDPKPLSIR